jgi:lipoprotein-anchoring transpeptidase ErfK/SrfK
MSREQRVREARLAVAVVAATVLALGAVGLVGAVRDPGSTVVASPVDAAGPATTTTEATAASVAAPADGEVPAGGEAATGVVPGQSTEGDLVEAVAEDCIIESEKLVLDDTGPDVRCLQQGLINAGYTSVEVTGTFDAATFAAVKQLQTERDLFVDGVVGRETAMSIGIWPDEESFVIRTPPPPPGAKDSWGFPLSSVSSTGENAPPLPPNSGSGKRVVYDRRGQRVWAVDENEQVIRSWLVSGSKYGNEQPGEHVVYSRSEMSSAWNFQAKLPLMIRYQKTAIGAIGFHGIPIRVSDGQPYQTEAELGTRLSGGCQRQANADAAFLWAFAPVGTKVVVI